MISLVSCLIKSDSMIHEYNLPHQIKMILLEAFMITVIVYLFSFD